MEETAECVEAIVADGCAGCVDRDVVEIIETIAKHQGRIKRLLKALTRAVAKCCATTRKSSDEDLTQ
jgi:hypothetical protein